jgi:hypothetical protein
MPSVNVRVRDGEATLTARVLENPDLDEICAKAKQMGFMLDRLEFTSLAKGWEQYRGAESLVQLPYIVLRREGDDGRFGHLIVKLPGDETYGLWSYHWTP